MPLLRARALTLAFLLSTIAAPALAAALTADSKIDSVTVYPDAAVVTRLAEVDLPDGDSTLRFAGLPMGLDPSTLRVEAIGEARVEIAGVESSVAADDSKAGDDTLSAKLAALTSERDTLNVEISALQGERSMIAHFAQTGPEKMGADAKPLSPADWEGAWRAIHDGLAKVDGALSPAQAQVAKLDAQIKALAGERAQEAKVATRLANVALLARGAGHATFKLSYRIANVGWTPAYDASLDTTTNRGDVTLTRRALIAQRSGEDWRDVALTVSTARVAGATDAVALDTLHIDFWAPALDQVQSRAAAPANAPVAAEAAKPAPAPQTLKKETPSVETIAMARSSAYAADFLAPGRVTILSDGSQRSIALAKAQSKATLTMKTAPAVDPAVYLQAKFVNDGSAPILPGDVSILRDGAFIGSGQLAFVAPGDAITLGFGADDRIKVQRAPVNRKENEPTWFNQSKIETREVKTTIKNLHTFPVSVQVVEQMPVSQNTAISVDMAPVTTPPTDKQVNGKPGVLGWSVDLAPDESKDVHFGYRLKWPADREVGFDGEPLAQR